MKATLTPLLSVIGGEVAVRAANFAAALLIARVYGGLVLGIYAACIAVVTVATMFADNGLQTSAILELSGEIPIRGKALGKLYLSKAILTLVAILILAGFAFGMRLSGLVWVVGLWVTLRTTLQSYAQLHMSILKALSKASWIGKIQIVHSLLLLIGIWTAFEKGWTVIALLAWLASGQLFELLLTGLVIWRAGLRPEWPKTRFFWASMKRSTPLGITYGLACVIIRLDTIVLAAMASLPELGRFSAANAMLAVFYVVSWLFGSVLLPEMVCQSVSPENLRAYARKWTLWIGLTMTPVAIAMFWAAPKAVAILYGPEFARSGALASVMALACPFILLNSVYANLAIATNSKTIYLGVFAATAAFTLCLDFFLGRSFGSMGIARAIVIREIGMLAGLLLLTSRITSPAAELSLPASP